MNPRNWQPLRMDEGDGVVLAINFEAGRGDAGFGDLADLLDGHPVYEAGPAGLGDGPGRPDEPQDYLGRWLDDVKNSPARITGVLGYCAGASLACALTELMAGAGMPRPPLVLLDPSLVTAEMVYGQFLMAIESFARFVPEERMGQARALANDALRRATGGEDGIDELAGRLRDAYRDLAYEPCRLLNVQESLAEQLCGRFAAFLGYLSASWRAAPPRPGVPPTLVFSRAHTETCGLEQDPIRIDAARGDLLRDPRCAEAVDTALRGDRPASASDGEVRAWIARAVAERLGCAPETVRTDRPLVELGLDSVDGANLCGLIEDHYDVAVDTTVIWDHPTIDAIAGFVQEGRGR